MKLLLLIGLCFSQSLFAGELALEEFKDVFKTEFESPVSSFETSCGIKVETTLDYENLSKGTSEEDRRSVGGYCGIGLDALRTICEKGDKYKALVVKKVKSFKCEYSTTGRSFDIKDGKVTWVFDYKSEHDSGHSDYIAKRLLELL